MSSNIKDLIVVGSGMGGALIGALNQNKETLILEKEPNLGGCASSFKHHGYSYNTGATTLVGYEENHPLKRIFDEVGFTPDLKKSDIAIRTIQNGKIVDRVKDFETFLKSLDEVYYHPNNRIFWQTMKELDELFWQLKSLHYAKHSLKAYQKTICCVWELYGTFKSLLFKEASSYINEVLPNISKEYQAFIDAQLLITVQSSSKNIPLLSMALGLSYPFHDVFYVNNGMGQIFKDLLKPLSVHKNEEVLKIEKHKKVLLVKTRKEEYLAKNVVVNMPIFESFKLFDDYDSYLFYEQFQPHEQSAFVVYLKVKSKEQFLHHYQLILNHQIAHTTSQAMFVSFSDCEDGVLSKDGYSVTISMHTNINFWKQLSMSNYEVQKHRTQTQMIKEFLACFDTLKPEDISSFFSATSKTFQRYINRSNCGGHVLNMNNLLQFPSCTTPFKGVYHVGDSVFAGQGWPGVALGVEVLQEELKRRF